MTSDEIFAEFVAGFSARKFSAGLLIAFIDLFTHLGVPGAGMTSLADVLARFPRQLMTAAGARANTLIVSIDRGTVSLRPFYNAAERFFRAEHKRFDYPSCAPHATQAWVDYIYGSIRSRPSRWPRCPLSDKGSASSSSTPCRARSSTLRP